MLSQLELIIILLNQINNIIEISFHMYCSRSANLSKRRMYLRNQPCKVFFNDLLSVLWTAATKDKFIIIKLWGSYTDSIVSFIYTTWKLFKVLTWMNYPAHYRVLIVAIATENDNDEKKCETQIIKVNTKLSFRPEYKIFILHKIVSST